jgi:hypothetical protein
VHLQDLRVEEAKHPLEIKMIRSAVFSQIPFSFISWYLPSLLMFGRLMPGDDQSWISGPAA